MLGYAVHTSAYAPENAIAFGDYSYYNIGDRSIRSFKQLNELFAGNGMIGYVAKERVVKIAVMYAVAYLYEHREDADHHDLTLSLRSLLFGIRKEEF